MILLNSKLIFSPPGATSWRLRLCCCRDQVSLNSRRRQIQLLWATQTQRARHALCPVLCPSCWICIAPCTELKTFWPALQKQGELHVQKYKKCLVFGSVCFLPFLFFLLSWEVQRGSKENTKHGMPFFEWFKGKATDVSKEWKKPSVPEKWHHPDP